ncbi:MAG: hypothetical protein WC812_00350 [Candidatus Pacearchaeota archaeon]|jgi:hypothetical protein
MFSMGLTDILHIKESISTKWDSNLTEDAHRIIEQNENYLREKLNNRSHIKFYSEAIITFFGLSKKIKTTAEYNVYY